MTGHTATSHSADEPQEPTTRELRLNVAQVIRDGGGTASVELVVASKLRSRGHRVRVFGPAEVGEQTRTAGFDFETLEWPSHLGRRTPDDLIARMLAAAVPWANALAAVFSERADVVVADCAVFGALMAAKLAGVPCAALMPTVYVAGTRPSAATNDPSTAMRIDEDSQDPALVATNRSRSALGLPTVASLTEQILDVDRLLLLTSRTFELPQLRPPADIRYVGYQRPPAPDLPRAADWFAGDTDQPLILVSLSTTDQADQLGLLERVLEAIAPLPVRALVTLGPTIDPGQLRSPSNVVLENFVPHAAVLPHVSLVITHAGHGTVMAAIAAGVPLLCVPLGRDQPAVARRVTHHRLGLSLQPDANVDEVRAAIVQALNDQAYRLAAQRMAAAIAGEDPNRVVDEIERLA